MSRIAHDVWVAIPAYGEAATIREVVVGALAVVAHVVVVDDGSRDGTADRLEGLPVELIRHDVNRGKAASLRSAFARALAGGAACVVTLDGDGQHDPADVPRLLDAWRQVPDRIVIGARLHDHAAIPPLRLFGNRFACFWISWAAGHAIADSQSGFRVYPRAVLEMATSGRVASDRFTFESEVLIVAARRGHPTLAVPIAARYPPDARRSHYRAVVDTARIVALVAGQLLQSGLSPRGLWRALRGR